MSRRSAVRVVVSLLALLIGAPAASGQMVINVPGDVQSIQLAIVLAPIGAIIEVAPGDYVGPVDFIGKTVTVRSKFGPDVTTISGAGPVVICASGELPGTRLEGFKITEGAADEGGGLYVQDSSITVVDCVFSDNIADGPGGALLCHGTGEVVVRDCVFRENIALAGGGLWSSMTSFEAVNCAFIDNIGSSSVGGAGFGGYGQETLVNCLFSGNDGSFLGGGVLLSGYTSTAVNCVFSCNTATHGAGVYATKTVDFVNCTVAGNLGEGFTHDSNADVDVTNCIIWDNDGGSIVADQGGGAVHVETSDVQGGWEGSGGSNFDFDPMFVQSAEGPYRLGASSPCLDAGDTAALPADELDVDGDGDVTEPVPLDLAGVTRIIDGAVDLGAYESAYQSYVFAEEEDLDSGEQTILILGGDEFDPLQYDTLIVQNVSGVDDATMLIVQTPVEIPLGDDYEPIDSMLTMETTLADGEHRSLIMMPFDSAFLQGADPFEVDLVALDGLGGWGLAAVGNTQTSPGHGGTIGDRIEVTGPGPYGVNLELGDHGVYWDPEARVGLAWVNVDYAAGVALRVPFACPADLTGDRIIDQLDMVELIIAWGQADPDADVNRDGVIDIEDLIAVILAWGSC